MASPENINKANEAPGADAEKGCCLKGDNEAKGYCALGIGRGAVIMSNIFLSSSLIQLASEEAGCVLSVEDDSIEIPLCTARVYGFLPSSLITNIAVISGLVSAFSMPIIGAIVDYTSHRRHLGVFSAVLMLGIQAAQIGTTSSTWFVMAVLQSVAVFVYQAQVLSTYAYIPEIARRVGEETMNGYTTIFQICQFASSLVFLLLISFLALFVGLNNVVTAQVSQAVDVCWTGIAFIYGWRMFNNVPPLQKIPEGLSLIGAGFKKIWSTSKNVNKFYGGGLRWYFLAVVFAEAGFNAFTSVSVTYLNDVLRMDAGSTGIVFAIVYISSFPGSKLGAIITKKTNPITSWKMCILVFILFTVSGSFVLTNENRKLYAYIWGGLWGLGMGWHYPTQSLILSLILPKGQEGEFAGFWVFCSQILVWLPPLTFTLINESGVHMKYALMSLNLFYFIALLCLMLMDPWYKVTAVAKEENKIVIPIENEEKKDVSEADV